ncbi:MAG: prolyl oligopeptidase family serine peptidase [Armatimonadetes bacterium]|nr:prolyl oligopeptidase family serine peptidase [Armatimonadota bacterium]
MIHMVLILSICAALLFAGVANAEISKGFLIKTVSVGGKDYKYVVYVPLCYDGKKASPAIIFLNGKGECGSDGWRQVFHFGSAIMLDAEKWPFIVMFPQKQSPETQWEDEEAMVLSILEKTCLEYKIDKSRLYLTGLSQGGHGTWAIAARHPDLFAAIAPVCGYGEKSLADKVAMLPVWIFHGDADQVVPVEKAYEMEKWIKEAGGSPKLTIYPGVGHNSWDKAYREENLGAWFLEHEKAK